MVARDSKAARFEERWKAAQNQTPGEPIKVDAGVPDLTPQSVMAMVRELAEMARADGLIGDEDYKTLTDSSNEIERILTSVSAERLRQCTRRRRGRSV